MNELGGKNYIRRLGLNSTGEFWLIAVKPENYTPATVFRNVISFNRRRIDLNIEKEPYVNALHGDPRFAALVAHAKQRAAVQKAN